MKRNSLAHEEIRDYADIISKWNDICSKPIIDENGKKIPVNLNTSEEIVKLCKDVDKSQSLKTQL